MGQHTYSIPASLSPEYKGNYAIVDCPQCGRHRAYCYLDSGFVTCNRESSCQYRGHIRSAYDYEGEWTGVTLNVPKAEDESKKPENLNKEKNFKCALGQYNYSAESYLRCRLPGYDVKQLFEKKIIGASRAIKDMGNLHEWLVKNHYYFFCPLYNIPTDIMVSGQARFCEVDGHQVPVIDDKPRKVTTFKNCPYGTGGATFGKMSNALRGAEKIAKETGKMPQLIIAEGMTDYITLKACGYKNVVGVPGVGQAKNVAFYLRSIGWRGILILSLDGDEAGAAGIEKVEKTLRGYHEIIICNARKDKMDINDVFREWGGAEAIKKFFEFATTKTMGGQTVKSLGDNDSYQEMFRDKLWAFNTYICPLTKDRLRVEIAKTGGKKSALAKFARFVICGEVFETEFLYENPTSNPLKIATRKRVSESPYCLHCMVPQWNLSICPFLLEKWPKKLLYMKVPFERGNLEQALKIKKDICDCTRPPRDVVDKDKECSNSLFVIIDYDNSHVIAVTTAEGGVNYVASSLRAYGKLDPIRLKPLLRDLIRPAFFSLSEYLLQQGEDMRKPLFEDKILTTKAKRFACRAGLPWPKTQEVKETVRKKCQESRPVVEKPKDVIGDSIFVTYRERNRNFRKFVGISHKPLGFENIVRKDVFNLPMQFHPQSDDANIMDSPSKSEYHVPKIIEDFFWTMYGTPSKGQTLYMYKPYAPPTSEQTNKKRNKAQSFIDEMSDWDHYGYRYDKYNFLPGDISLSQFQNIRRQEDRGDCINQWLRKPVPPIPLIKRPPEFF